MSRIHFSILSAFCLVLLACPRSTEAAVTYANGVSFGQVMAPEINEASGLAASRQNPGVLWTHNDSTYPGSVFALSTNGTLLARYWVPNVFYGDFEDIAVGPGPSPERQYIYLGDIGDNSSSRSSIRVLRFPEPAVYGYQSVNPPIAPVPDFKEITLTYPDEAHDAEAMMMDPITGDLFIVTKEDPDARLYRASRAQLESNTAIQLTYVRKISFNEFRLVSAGDISFDGRLIALRRGGRAWVWSRLASQTVDQALSVAGTVAKVVNEPNGESIAFEATGLGYFTVSETSPSDKIYTTTNYYFRRTDLIARQPTVFINPGDAWRYRDDGTDQGVAWRQPGFNDSTWATGSGQFGYGEGDEQTVISYGSDDFDKSVTTYFRRQFTRPATVPYTNLALRVCFNDGVAVYLNGTEVLRRNLAPGAAYRDPATAANAERQNYWLSIPISPSLVVSGLNTVAVEVHRFQPADPSLTFDLQLGEATIDLPARFTSLPQIVGGQCRISISGPSGALVRVEATSDFQSWIEAGQVVLVGGAGQFQEAVGSVPRFYRLRQ